MELVKPAFWQKGREVFLPLPQRKGQQQQQQGLFGTSDPTLGHPVYAHCAYEHEGGRECGGGVGDVQQAVSLKSCWEDTDAFPSQLPLAGLSHIPCEPVCKCEHTPLSPVVLDREAQHAEALKQVSPYIQAGAQVLPSEFHRLGGWLGKLHVLGRRTGRGMKSRGDERGSSPSWAQRGVDQHWATSVDEAEQQPPMLWSRGGEGSGVTSWVCFSPLAPTAASDALAQRLARDQSTQSRPNSCRTWRVGGGGGAFADGASAQLSP